MAATVIHGEATFEWQRAMFRGGDLWAPLDDVTASLGWERKPEGICRGDICIPVPEGQERRLLSVDEREMNLSEFAQLIEQPVAASEARGVAYLGSPSWEWRHPLPGGVAPDFELPDFEGRLHRLSDYRGSKVFLLCWASWCSCRLCLPIWKELRDELHAQGFEVVAVACESKGPEAALPWVEAADASYPMLLDTEHLVPELFNTRNVPAAFWIDEEGRVVRANDPIYAERRNFQTGEFVRNEGYLNALRDWVARGSDSEFVRGAPGLESVIEQTWENVSALAHFRLGLWLHEQGHEEAATEEFKRAHQLEPANWNYKRQAWNLDGIEEYGYENVLQAIRDPAAPEFYRQVDIVNQW
ncbi:MAG: redoxin domain-containing protein [Dehalococcoidia bacterium]